MKLDGTDRKILNLMQENARRSFKDMAKRVGVSEATIFVRVKKLVNGGVIKAFRAVVDPQVVGKGTLAFVLLKANPNKYDKVLEALSKMEDVYEIYDVTGPHYAILKVRAGSQDELAGIIDKIGSIDGVTSTETDVVLRNVKEDLILHL